MGQHIVGQEQIGAAALIDQLAGSLLAEKLIERGDAVLLGDTGNVGSGLDSEARNAALDEVFQ